MYTAMDIQHAFLSHGPVGTSKRAQIGVVH